MTISEGARAVQVATNGRVNARPYLQRADANVVAEAEAIRDTLHQAWLDECSRRGLEANVLVAPLRDATVDIRRSVDADGRRQRYAPLSRVDPHPPHSVSCVAVRVRPCR